MYNTQANMKGRYYLEITFGDNDWYEAMELILPAIKQNIINYNNYYDFTGDKNEGLFEALRKLIAAQLNLASWFEQSAAHNYEEDVAKIKFAIVPFYQVKNSDNYETAYVQLFGPYMQLGNYFIV